MRKYNGLKRAIDVLTVEISLTKGEYNEHSGTGRGFRALNRLCKLRTARTILKSLSNTKECS